MVKARTASITNVFERISRFDWEFHCARHKARERSETNAIYNIRNGHERFVPIRMLFGRLKIGGNAIHDPS